MAVSSMAAAAAVSPPSLSSSTPCCSERSGGRCWRSSRTAAERGRKLVLRQPWLGRSSNGSAFRRRPSSTSTSASAFAAASISAAASSNCVAQVAAAAGSSTPGPLYRPVANFMLKYPKLAWAVPLASMALEVVAAGLLALLTERLLDAIARRLEDGKPGGVDDFVEALRVPLSVLVWVVGAVKGINILGEHVVHMLPWANREQALQVNAVTVKACQVAAVACFGWISIRVQKAALGMNTQWIAQQSTRRLLLKLGTYTTWVVSTLVAMDLLGVETRALLAFGGVGGLAIGLASQSVVSNLVSGLMMLITRPFLESERIALNNGSLSGVVENIGIYHTRLITDENVPVFVPNSVFSSAVIHNLSRKNSHTPQPQQEAGDGLFSTTA